jgi:hypothetical protein
MALGDKGWSKTRLATESKVNIRRVRQILDDETTIGDLPHSVVNSITVALGLDENAK